MLFENTREKRKAKERVGAATRSLFINEKGQKIVVFGNPANNCGFVGFWGLVLLKQT